MTARQYQQKEKLLKALTQAVISVDLLSWKLPEYKECRNQVKKALDIFYRLQQ